MKRNVGTAMAEGGIVADGRTIPLLAKNAMVKGIRKNRKPKAEHAHNVEDVDTKMMTSQPMRANKACT